MQFASGRSTTDEYAIKFFTDPNAFEREAEMYCKHSIRAMMPSVAVVESNAAKSVTGPGGYAFPPFIVVEKGESLDEWVLRVQPDFVTILQVLAPQPHATPAAASYSVDSATAAKMHAPLSACGTASPPHCYTFRVVSTTNHFVCMDCLLGMSIPNRQRIAGWCPKMRSLGAGWYIRHRAS